MRPSADPPHAAIEPARLARRLDRLARLEEQASLASESFERIRTPRKLRIRAEFAWRSDPAAPHGDLADRLLPPRNERPPATRLVSPRGIALRLHLTALFVAQSRPSGTMPANTLPLADADVVSWTDLIATTAERHGYTGRREKKLRQVHDALRRLSNPEVQLVTLPNLHRGPTGKYEGFLLMHEGGAPARGRDNQRYTVPRAESKTMYLPGGLFLNGWIHVLEDSELAFLLMLACLRSRSDAKPVFATSEVRLLRFGLGRDAYESHRILSRLGLVRVHPGPHPGRRYGRAGRYLRSDPPKPHRFELLNEGFEEPALPTARQALAGLPGAGMGARGQGPGRRPHAGGVRRPYRLRSAATRRALGFAGDAWAALPLPAPIHAGEPPIAPRRPDSPGPAGARTLPLTRHDGTCVQGRPGRDERGDDNQAH